MPRDHRSSTSNKTDAGGGGGRSKRESSRSKPGSDGVKGSSKASSYGSSKSKDSGSRDRRRIEKHDNRVATLEGFKSEKKPSYAYNKKEDPEDHRYNVQYRFPL